MADAVFVLHSNFTAGPQPDCLAACDVNGDGIVAGHVSDALYILNYRFRGGPPPVEPFPQCGSSQSAKDALLGCITPPRDCQ